MAQDTEEGVGELMGEWQVSGWMGGGKRVSKPINARGDGG